MENTYTPMADSCQCMAKTTTILLSNQPPIKINKLKKTTQLEGLLRKDGELNVLNDDKMRL